MVGNVVAVQAFCACLEIGRCISIRHAQPVQIRHDRARLGEREPAIELQSVGRTGNTWMALLCHILCHSERRRGTISNDEIRMTRLRAASAWQANDETNPNDKTRNGAHIAAQSFVIWSSSFIRHSSFELRHFAITSSREL